MSDALPQEALEAYVMQNAAKLIKELPEGIQFTFVASIEGGEEIGGHVIPKATGLATSWEDHFVAYTVLHLLAEDFKDGKTKGEVINFADPLDPSGDGEESGEGEEGDKGTEGTHQSTGESPGGNPGREPADIDGGNEDRTEEGHRRRSVWQRLREIWKR